MKDFHLAHTVVSGNKRDLARLEEVDEQVAQREEVVPTTSALEFELVLGGKDHVTSEDRETLLLQVVTIPVDVLFSEAKVY